MSISCVFSPRGNKSGQTMIHFPKKVAEERSSVVEKEAQEERRVQPGGQAAAHHQEDRQRGPSGGDGGGGEEKEEQEQEADTPWGREDHRVSPKIPLCTLHVPQLVATELGIFTLCVWDLQCGWFGVFLRPEFGSIS
jgi:hypothetical protein